MVLEPDSSIDAALVTGGTVADDEAHDLDIVGSRLVGVRFTAAHLDRLRLMVDDSEKPLA